MITVDLGYHRTARLWTEELPDLTCPPGKVFKRRRPTTGESHTARRIALELYVPMGVRVLYGLLGTEYQPQPAGELLLSVPVCAGTGDPVPWSLASRVDDVRAGLPADYAPAVLDCADRAAAILGPGGLRFAPAAHAAAGSAPAVFRSLAMALVDLLGVEQTALVPNQVRELIAREIIESQLVYA